MSPIKQEVSAILQAALSGQDAALRYNGYIRWGLVESRIHAALDALIAERDALKERAENAERSERRLAAMLTHQQELEAERDALRKALEPFATAYIGSTDYLTRADYRRAYLAYNNTQPDQGGKDNT